ncbi:MAG: peptidase domain-containing ABC transporter [Saprospiraceae bacterium]
MESIHYSPTRRFFKLLQPDRKDIYYIYIYAIFSGIITLSLPLGTQAIIGLIAGGSVSSSWGLLIFIVTLGSLLGGVVKIMQMIVTETLQRRIFARSSFDFAFRLPRFSIESTRSTHMPELVNRFFDTLTIQKGLPKILMDVTEAILQIFFGLLVLVFYNSMFVVFSFFLVLILLLIFYITGPNGLKTSLTESKYKYSVAYWLEEVGRTSASFKLGGYTDLPLNRTDDLVVKYLDARKKHFKVLTIQYGSLIVFKTLITFLLLIIGSILVIDNQINLGQFIAAEIIVLQIINSVEKLIVSMDTVYDVLTALEKIGKITDMPLEVEKGISFELCDTGNGMNVELHNLSYQFSDSNKEILKKINLQIGSGERVCIAGYNGSGKSTLIKIIAGLFENFKGQLSYNGLPVGGFLPSSLRSRIGDLSSKEDIFHGSVLDNITMGHHGISYQDAIEAAKKVGVHAFIQTLPEGYKTELLPQGRTLSRSSRTKIVLARNISCNPSLLVIEDIMNQLERADRDKVIDILTDKSCPWTLVAVSNDKQFARKCDRVIIMDKGSIVLEGSYEQIIKSEHFSKVFDSQA